MNQRSKAFHTEGRKYLDESSVNQNSSAQAVEDTADNGCPRAIWIVGRLDTESDGNSDRSCNAIEQSAKDGKVSILTRQFKVC